MAIYWASLAGLFATSASYHRLARTPKSVLWFRRADHSMIYVLIAGTYTPFALLLLDGTTRWVVFLVVWGGAMVMLVFIRDLGSSLMFFGAFLAVPTAAVVAGDDVDPDVDEDPADARGLGLVDQAFRLDLLLQRRVPGL